MIGKKGVETAFGRTFSDTYNIHRTRINFPNNGLDTFENMAKTGISVIDKIIADRINGMIDYKNDIWEIPIKNIYETLLFK